MPAPYFPIRNLHKRRISKRIRTSYTPKVRSKKPCRHALFHDYDAGETVCSKCHQILDYIYVNEPAKVKNSDMLIWNRDYDKQRWILDTLNYLNGEHNDCFNDLVWMEVLEDIPNPCTWYQVYHVFHTYRLTDFWTCFPSYVSLPIHISRKVLRLVLEYSDLGYTRYRISFMYLFYKFTQMEDERNGTCNSLYIPLKGTKPWLKKTDEWWQTICEQKEWAYYPSKTHKITWDKTHIVSSLKRLVDALS